MQRGGDSGGGAAAARADGEQPDRTRPNRASGATVGISSATQMAIPVREEQPKVDRKSGEATHGTSQAVPRNSCTGCGAKGGWEN